MERPAHDGRADRWVREFAAASPEATIGFDRPGTIVIFNSRAENLFGYAAGEVVGRPIQLLVPGLVPGEYETGGSGVDLELDGRRKNADTFHARVRLTPVGSLHVVLVEDLDERGRAERVRTELVARERAARAEAERMNLMQDEFLATLSHELRTPLNAMLGWTQLLRSHSSDSDVQARAIETIERNIRVQTRLIDDLLDMSSIVSGEIRLSLEDVQLGPLVEAAVEGVSLVALDKGITVVRDLDPGMGSLRGDPNRLRQIVEKLLSNALKFTLPGGRVRVGLRQVGSYARLEVSDTGQGIARTFLPQLFDRFRQADTSTTRVHGGLGLGLAIVRSLVVMHGGTVRARSGGSGAGTTFIVRIPLAHEFPPECAHERAPSAPAPQAIEDLRGVRVLVVDDDRDGRDFVRQVLVDYGAVVLVAASATEALAAIIEHRPTVLLCDLAMPGEDGYALIRKVRALDRERGGETPAAALTAYTRPEDQARVVQSGFQTHVPKPVEPARLLEVVARLARSQAS